MTSALVVPGSAAFLGSTSWTRTQIALVSTVLSAFICHQHVLPAPPCRRSLGESCQWFASVAARLSTNQRPRAMGTSACQSSAVGKSHVPADTAHGSPKERNPSAEWLAIRHLWHELGDRSGGTVGKSRLSLRLDQSDNDRMCCALQGIQTSAQYSPCTELSGGQQGTWDGNREKSI